MQNPESTPISGLDCDGTLAGLQRILASEVFAKAPVLSRFLSYLVQRRVEGSTTPPKEYAIGVDVFGRGASFDPRTDTIVRVQARRLRKRLSRYYEGQGRADPIRMTIPKGHYQVEIAAVGNVAETPDPSHNARTLPAFDAQHEAATNAGPTAIRRPGRRLGYWAMGIVAVAVVLVLISQFVLPRARTAHEVAASPDVPAKSIAVLPFANLSSDKNNAYFVQGIQDLILTKLANIGDLKVIARTSTLHYGSNPEDLTRIGEQLGVATILEGSVQKAGDQVLINVQLIDTKTDAHIWAKAYTRTLNNVFGVEGEVAAKIAVSLKARLSGAERARLARVPTHNQAAYDLFLRAQYQADKGATHYITGDFSGFRAAIPLYRQAIAKDPGFALAYARLSMTESTLASVGGQSVERLDRQARADADMAGKLAPHAAATALALGYYDYYGKGDYTGALKHFAAALALSPNDSRAIAARGFVERKQRRLATAIASLQQAFSLDPRNSPLASEIGATYLMASRYPRAESWFRRALALDPDNLNARFGYPRAIIFGSGDVTRALAATRGKEPAMQLLRSGLLTYERKYTDALAVLAAIPDTPQNFPLVVGRSKAEAQADLYRLMGERKKAGTLYKKVLGELRPQLAKEKKQQNPRLANVWLSVADSEIGLGHTAKGLAAVAKARALVNAKLKTDPPAYVGFMGTSALLYAEAGRADLAVPLLAKVLAMPAVGAAYSPALLWLAPALDPIRHDPRFQALLKKYAKYQPARSTSTASTATL